MRRGRGQGRKACPLQTFSISLKSGRETEIFRFAAHFSTESKFAMKYNNASIETRKAIAALLNEKKKA